MARINIENDLYTRGEWFNLVIAVGSPDTAIGSLVRAWTVAQRYWFPCRQFIPNDVWKRETLNEAIIEAGLAQRTDEGVYVNGCEEQFEWLFIAQEKGKKGGERSAESKKNKAEKVREESNHRSTTGVPQVEILASKSTTVNPLTLTPTLINNKIGPDKIIALFNRILAGKGKVKSFNFTTFGGQMLTDFINCIGHEEFSTVEQWEEYFNLVAKRPKLLNYPATIWYLIKFENATNILSGAFEDQDPAPKTNPKGKQDAQAMSSRMIDTILRNGMHGLKQTLAEFNQQEIKAIDIFGRASEILSCTDFQMQEIKTRLRNACEESLKINPRQEAG